MIYKKLHSNDKDAKYVAPFIGNGNMTLQIDYEGAMGHKDESGIIKNNPAMRIWWAGRRHMHSTQKRLVSYGFFEQQVLCGNAEAEISDSRQILDVKNAAISTACEYNRGGIQIRTNAFLHHDYNLIAINKAVDSANPAKFIFCYRLCEVADTKKLPELMSCEFAQNADGGVDIRYSHPGCLFPCEGIISVFSDSGVKGNLKDNTVYFEIDVVDKKEFSFYIFFCDSIDAKDYPEISEKIRKDALKRGFESLRKEHSLKWNEYFTEGYAKIDDEIIDNAYITAQYHLKCFTTKWSIPVGLTNTLWEGRYFAFDELYMLMGLLTSNHFSLAKRAPFFRFDGLGKAIERASSKKKEPIAHYPWETLEDGSEGAKSGFWHDHIFHMACVACVEYFYYKYSGDEEFLENIAYPVIKRCGLFYLEHTIYEVKGGKLIVGKCTDLERLGSSNANAFMTTCGVIKTLNILAEVAEKLRTDESLAARCKETAGRLLDGLPQNDGKYIPYDSCQEVSIGLLSGTYPFDVIDRDDPLQLKGIESYLAAEQKVGNVYSVGTGVCSWYLTWKALVFARLLRKQDCFKAIKDAAVNSGRFGEMYEINDTKTMTIYRPWFSTAAGMLIHAVNEMLLKSDEGIIHIAPALPECKKDFSFRLAAFNGICVETEVKDGSVKRLVVSGSALSKSNFMTVKLPRYIDIEDIVKKDAMIEMKDKENSVLIVKVRR